MIKIFKLLLLSLLIFMGITAYQMWQETLQHRPVVSVIVPAYNMGNTLPATIDSVLEQTFPDWELIVINDGSTDNTQYILKYYQHQDPRVRVIQNKENLGLIASLNKGLEIARGEYIVRLDADDTSYPDRLTRQIVFMNKHALDLAGAALDTPDVKFQEGQAVAEDQLDNDLLKINLVFGNIFAHSTMIFRKDFLEKFGLNYDVNHPHAEDYDLWVKMAMHGAKMGIMGGRPVTTYQYSNHNGRWWKISDESFQETRLSALREIAPDLAPEQFELPMCQLLKLLIKENEKTQILNPEKLSEFELNRCISLLLFKHPQWEDSLVHLHGNRFRRRNSSDQATVTRSQNQITIKWDRWPTEIYECSEIECEKIAVAPKD